jgi:methionyl aminopeptidase
MISIKTAAEQAMMAKACRLTAQCMELMGRMVRPGVSTAELDRAAESFIREHGGSPTFKGYRGFPGSICASINEIVVHGIPSDRKLADGDIIGIDIGVTFEGFTGDMARTFIAGKASREAEELVSTTKECFFKGFGQMKPGARIGDISWAVQQHAEARGYSVVRDLCGHGVGRELWEEPELPNFGKPGRGVRLEAGMTLALEPMINIGTWKIEIDETDGWTVRTADRKLSAHYEESVLITAAGAEILTVP